MIQTSTTIINNPITQTVHLIQTQTINNPTTIHLIKTKTINEVATEVIHSIITETVTTALPSEIPEIAAPSTITEHIVHITSTITVCSACQSPTPIINPPAAAPAAATHSIIVGGLNGLLFSPPSIEALPGDILHFTFLSQNHTVTQSTFGQPCIPMIGGADSGYKPNPNNTVIPAPIWEYQVKDTTPTWWFCAQNSHCGKGMVFAVNPTREKTFRSFQDTAVAM
ncbi:hypothetical protein BZA77DRAFT_243775, partial [Pyronema omphalodes]